MRKHLLALCLMTALCLSGCAQPVEKSPVTIQDEKTPQVTPIATKTAETSAAEKQPNEIDSIKEHLQDVTTLDNAISPFYISDEQGDVEWRLQKCDGGFGFYYPVYGDDDIRAWNMPEPTNTEEDFIMGINVYSSKSRMQIVILCIENLKLKDVETDYFNPKDKIQLSDCTIGIHNYPALKTECTPTLEETDTGGGPPSEFMYNQHYFTEGPEGLLDIRLSSPSEESDQSWEEVEKMLNTFIIESTTDYTRKNSAIPINASPENLQFKTLDILSTFYTMCIVRGDYNSSIAVSRNITNNLKASEVWKSMKCYIAGEGKIIKNNRAVKPIYLTPEEPGNTGLISSGKEGTSIIRYIYFIKDGDHWYVDGPLHNTEPPEEWWQGQEFTWTSENYGLSDSADIGETITTQKETDDFKDQWAKKCR